MKLGFYTTPSYFCLPAPSVLTLPLTPVEARGMTCFTFRNLLFPTWSLHPPLCSATFSIRAGDAEVSVVHLSLCAQCSGGDVLLGGTPAHAWPTRGQDLTQVG